MGITPFSKQMVATVSGTPGVLFHPPIDEIVAKLFAAFMLTVAGTDTETEAISHGLNELEAEFIVISPKVTPGQKSVSMVKK
jgi:hypothetical protein